MPSSEDFAYAAGVMDSDGWFTCGFSKGIRTTGRPWAHWYFRCAVKQAEPHCVYFFQLTFGGSVNFRHDPTNKLSNRPVYIWSLVGTRLIPFVQGILPYMKIKKDRATLILEYYDEYKNLNTLQGAKHAEEHAAEHARRSAIRARLKEMNHTIHVSVFPA